MGTLLGFALGFYLGTKAGPNGLDELAEAWQTIRESEEFQGLSATARATLESLMEQGAAGVAQFVTGLMGAEEESGSERSRGSRREERQSAGTVGGCFASVRGAESGFHRRGAGDAIV